MPDFIPTGLFAGLGIGLIACLYFIRGDEPDWYRRFDPNKRLYENEVFSMRSIARACNAKSKFLPVKAATFVKCRFVGPDMAAFVGPMLRLQNSTFNDMGTPLVIPDQAYITGMVVFMGCEFDGCTFEKVQPVMPKDILETFQANIKPA